MKTLIVLLALITIACNVETVEPQYLIEVSGHWQDNESNHWIINGDKVTHNDVWEGYLYETTQSKISFVVELEHINWFYSITIQDEEWMPAKRWKTYDQDSLTITQDWDVLVKKLR
jgi:hypothetical protein